MDIKIFEKAFNEIFSKNLRYYMEKNSVSQNELARYLKVSPTSVNNWYNGYKTPRMDKVDRICKYFNINRSDLMEEHKDNKKESISRRAELPDGLVIAAHHDNDNDFTDEEWDSIIRFVEFVKSKEKK